MPSHILDDAARQFRNALDRQFNAKPRGEFRLRLSNIGQPTCKLWYEKNRYPAEGKEYNHPLKMSFGDVTEIILMAALHAAQVDITGVNEAGSIEVAGVKINGTSDVTISDQIWDIKSASAYSFQNKFNNPYGYSHLKENDDFGYIAQGHGYEMAIKKPFKGWLCVSKETGEVAALEVPEGFKDSAHETVTMLEHKVKALESKEFPGREFEDVPEKFKKKLTGNRHLGTACSYCPYKASCWPTLQHKPIQSSTASDPSWRWYTHIESVE